MTSDSRLRAVPEYEPWPSTGSDGADILEYVGPPAIEVVRPAVEPETTTVGIRALARNVSGVVAEVVRTGQPAIVTKHGAPFVAIIPIQRREGTALAAASEFLEELAVSDRRAGRSRSSSEVFAELARLADALAQAAAAAAG